MPFVRARWRLGEFELDATGDLPTLARGGTILPIQPKPLALLAFLIDHRDRIVSKDELLAALWPGVAVSEAALTSALRDLRRALADDAEHPRFIETRRGWGFRFVHPVEEIRAPADAHPVTSTRRSTRARAQRSRGSSKETRALPLRRSNPKTVTRCASPSSTRSRGRFAPQHALGRGSSSSTISTAPTRPRSSSCATWRARSPTSPS